MLAAILVVASAGCGSSPELGQVTGLVRFGSSPVTNGTVVFENRELGISVRANLDAEGRYHVQTYDRDGLPPGEYQVAVTPTRIGSGESPFVGGAQESAPSPSGPTIPDKYHRVKTSELVVVVQAGPNVADLNLQ